jgi:signal transduction histidine kinase
MNSEVKLPSEDKLSSALLQLLQGASSEPNPSTALLNLLHGFVTHTHASIGRLYKLNLAASAYLCVHSTCKDCLSPPIGVEILDREQSPESYLGQVIFYGKSLVINKPLARLAEPYFSPAAGSLMLLPIIRFNEKDNEKDDECLGVLTFEGKRPGHFTSEMREFGASIAAACLLLFEKQRTLELLNALQKPVDYETYLREFLDQLIRLITTSSGMPYIVLREYIPPGDPGQARESNREREEVLDCLAQVGFDAAYKQDIHCLDFHEVPEEMRPVLEQGESVIVEDADASTLPDLEATRAVKSFVATPVKVGEQVFGILSFGCSCRYDYTPLEVAGFEIIANGIGVAIANYRHFQGKHWSAEEKARINAVMTAVEVSQAARHEARAHLSNALVSLALIEEYAKKPTQKNFVKLLEYTRVTADELKKIEQSIDRIKNVTRPLRKERKMVVLNDLWKDAFGQVNGRLASESIEFDISGRNITIEAYPDYLAHAFLNLILNSIDAFREFGQKRNRHITVQIETPSDAQQDIVMTYTDNAGGIDPTRLTPQEDGTFRTVQEVFEKGVTSKRDGSGFGLFLVRKIMQEHRGSIDLVSHRGGVHFVLKLNKKGVGEA